MAGESPLLGGEDLGEGGRQNKIPAPRLRKIKATRFSKRDRLTARMKLAVESSISHWLMCLVLPTILAPVLVGCVSGNRSDFSNESDLPRLKRGDIIAVQEMPSPDGRYVCTVFGEIFYDTTGYDRHVYLRRAGEPRGYPGNVYVALVGDGVEVSWTSPTNLLVKVSYESFWVQHILPATTNIAEVTVSFSKLTR